MMIISRIAKVITIFGPNRSISTICLWINPCLNNKRVVYNNLGKRNVSGVCSIEVKTSIFRGKSTWVRSCSGYRCIAQGSTCEIFCLELVRREVKPHSRGTVICPTFGHSTCCITCRDFGYTKMKRIIYDAAVSSPGLRPIGTRLT